QDATILYIDDYLFTDADGNNDMPKERDQKQFYRNALAGYAFAEWDNDVQGVPVLADLAGIEVIVWCADSEIGTADGNYRLWYDIGAEGGGVLKEFMDGGGKLLLTGTQTLGYMYDSNPPASDAFESEYLGVSDSLIIDVVDTTWWLDDVAHDTLIVTPDSVTADTSYEETWFNEWWLTWVMKDSETTLDLPDSMKIDVAKQGDQDDYCSGMTFLRNDATVTTEPIFRWGLWVDGSAPAAPYYESIIGHITSWSGEPVSAMLNFDTYSMPPDGIRQTFVTILTEFGQ
ncbi:MAG: hypothetical protein GY839_19245, partial [candidate division Zixibacteria bacterium]|nr:hypothetical protein [candidate division Zixibacteria bacterium]